LHLDQIVAVAVPGLEQEAARGLVRARRDVRGDLMSARHRVSKLLLRQGIVYCGGRAWTQVHDSWLSAQHFEGAGLPLAYDTMLAAVNRGDRLDRGDHRHGRPQRLHPGGDPARVPARVSTLIGVRVTVEIGDWQRLTGRSIDAYLGLVPPESCSGTLPITRFDPKTGNGHGRRLLIEAAWHHRQPYRPGVEVRRRWDKASPAARAREEQGNRRLHARWSGLD